MRARLRDANVSPAREARFRLHLRRMQRKLARLRQSGHSDPNVLAILAVEAFYRPRARRIVEYAGWLVLSLLGRPSVERISVGTAQVRLSHWRDLDLLESARFSIHRLNRVRNLDANYEVCHRYLSERRMLREADVNTLTVAYVGAPRDDYAKMLKDALTVFAV